MQNLIAYLFGCCRRLRLSYHWLLLCGLTLFCSLQAHTAAAQSQSGPSQLSIVIELHDPALIEVYTNIANQNLVSSAALAAATQAQLAHIETAQQELLAALAPLGGQVLYRNQRVYNGIALRVATDQLDVLAHLPGVKAIHPLIAKTPANSRGVALLGAPPLWQGLQGEGLTGAGITIAVIDTGIDYLHTDLGGPGVGYPQNNRTTITDVVGFPNLKIIGGYDFTGDLYNANPEDASFNPALAPDPDPMDCYPHGTAVAGTAAGSGVNSDGTPYSGPYDQSTPLNTLRIGPGTAPAASLYALKVFGCTGSSEVVDQAIEWAVDPNGDGDLSDHVDVINLSLGSDYGSPYDLTTLASNRAAALGVIVVAAAGNAGDHYYISSSPANATLALSIAASQPIFQSTQGPAQFLYESMASFSARGPRRFDAALKPDLTAPGSSVVTAGQGTGSQARTISGTSLATPFVAGGMALLRQRYPTWSVTELKALVMNTAASHLRVSEAISSSLYSPVRVGAGRLDLVRALQTQSVAYNALEPGLVSLSFGAPAIYTTTVYSKALTVLNKSATPLPYTLDYVAITDQPGAKVDLPTAPFWVAANSSVTVPVALAVNAAALQRPRDPTVSPTEAGYERDWLSEESGYLLLWPSPPTFTVALAAPVTGRALFTYTPASRILSYTVQLQNLPTALTALTLGAGIPTGPSQIGYALFSGNLPAANPVTVSGAITLPRRAVLSLADQTLTLTMATVDQPAGVTQGQLRLAAPVLKVPLYAAPRVAANLHVAPQTLDFGGKVQSTAALTFTGNALTTSHPLSGVASLLSVALLQTTSPRLTITEPLTVLHHVNYADLRYVGVASYSNPTPGGDDPVAESTLYFAVATYEPWAAPNEVEISIVIDVDQDGSDDFALYNSDQVGYNSKRYSDSFMTALKDLRTGLSARQTYLNGVSPAVTAPGLYDNQVMLLPVSAAALGLTQQQPRFTYRVETYSNDALYRPNGQKRLIDHTAPRQYDVSQPGLRFRLDGTSQPLPYAARVNSIVEVTFDLAAYSVANGEGILFLQHHNRPGDNAEVLAIRYAWSGGVYLPVVLHKPSGK